MFGRRGPGRVYSRAGFGMLTRPGCADSLLWREYLDSPALQIRGGNDLRWNRIGRRLGVVLTAAALRGVVVILLL